LSQFAALDRDINMRTDALRDVAFPTMSIDVMNQLISPAKCKNRFKDLELCRISLEQWVFYVVSRLDVLSDELKDVIENFFFLPNGPNRDDMITIQDDHVTPQPSRPLKPREDDLESMTSNDTFDAEVKPKKPSPIKAVKRRLSSLITLPEPPAHPQSTQASPLSASTSHAHASSDGAPTGTPVTRGGGDNPGTIAQVKLCRFHISHPWPAGSARETLKSSCSARGRERFRLRIRGKYISSSSRPFLSLSFLFFFVMLLQFFEI
jgi:hypothetical protein